MRSTNPGGVNENVSQGLLSRRRAINQDETFEGKVVEASGHCDDGNGKPHGISHRNQINGRQGYVVNPSLNHGEPQGIYHDRDEDDRVQGLNNSGVEAIGESLQMPGEPKGNTSAIGIPMVVDPAVVDTTQIRSRSHQSKRMRLSNHVKVTTYVEDANNNPIVEFGPKIKYFKALVYPGDSPPFTDDMNDETRFRTELEWNQERRLFDFETELLRLLEIKESPKLSARETNKFYQDMRLVNERRRSLKKIQLPSPFDKTDGPKVYRIEPMIQILLPEIEPTMSLQEIAIEEAKYQDQLIAAQVEIDAIKYITTGNIPTMNADEKVRFDKYLKIVNDQREVEDGYELSLDKSFPDHIRMEHPNYALPAAQTNTRPNNPASDSDSDSDSSDSISLSPFSSLSNLPHSKSGKNVINICDSDSDDSLPPTTSSTRASITSPPCNDRNMTTINNDRDMSIEGEAATDINDKNHYILPKEKQLSNFITALMEIVTCPISMETMKHPMITENGNVFEKEQLFKWLRENNNRCPLSRSFIAEQGTKQCLTMKRLIELMNNNDITPDFVNEMCTERNKLLPRQLQDVQPASTQEQQPVPNVVEKSAKHLRKARRKKENKRFKNKLNKKIKEHKRMLQEHGYFRDENLKRDMPPRPSYSIMHSLEEGFSIVLYSRSHRVNLSSRLHLHRNCAIRLILGPEMCLIWHEGIFHSGAKSRNTPDPQQDLRFFSYVWPYIESKAGNRTSISCDGVNRSCGSRVHRENIHEQTCEYLYHNNDQCPHCRNEEMIIDLRTISRNSYLPSERIIGDLVNLGWMVVRTSRVPPEMNKSIVDIGKMGSGWGGSWMPIDSTARNRMIKYRSGTRQPIVWKSGLPKKFLDNIKLNVIKANLDSTDPDIQYTLENGNLLKNDGYIEYDQQPHTDYPPRLLM